MRACPESTSWMQYKVAQACVVMFKTWSNENCTEACSVLFPFGILELMEWRSLNKVPQSASLWLMPWDAPGQQFCPAGFQRALPNAGWGTTATLSLLVWTKQGKEYLIISEEMQTCCSNCRGGREGHALSELWIRTVLQHGSHPSLHGVCGLRLPVQSSSLHHEAGESQGLLLCLSPLLKGGQIPLGWKHWVHVTF